VTAVKIADGVTEYDARVTAPLREGSRTAEIDRAAADADLRQADRGSDSVAYAEIGWVQKAVRLEGDVNPVIADASGIGEIGTKNVIVGNGADLAARRARVSPSGQCVSLQRWFLSKILLDRDVTMEPVVGTKFIVYIGRALINVHGCACRGKEQRDGRACGGYTNGIGCRNECHKCLDCGVNRLSWHF